MNDCLVIGGGVIGLSLAYELAGRGLRVRLIDAGMPGREASWAGAGILPPAGETSTCPLEQLTALSNELHASWSDELREKTGIDNGYRRSGGIYLARDFESAEALRETARHWRQTRIAVEMVSPADLADLEPQLQPTSEVSEIVYLPQEHQLRNPRHLKALLAGCAQRGVEIQSGTPAEDFEIHGGRIIAVRSASGRLVADRFCIASGAWSHTVAARLGPPLAIRPIRGQILLLNCQRPLLRAIVNEGSRYLVPRPDGRLLVGSTEEDAGYDRSNTPAGVAGLVEFAMGLAPALGSVQLERTWAGLRPATSDGLPYVGRVSGLDNAFIAAGHFRSGLQLSTGTAAVLARAMCDETPPVDLAPFRLNR